MFIERPIGAGFACALVALAAGAGRADAETFARPSVGAKAAQANGSSVWSDVSGDGRHVAFPSEADNLVAGDANETSDVFVRDRKAQTTERVSVGPGGVEGDGYSNNIPAISRDGRFVAFTSAASNLVADDRNGSYDVFVRDRHARATYRVSVASDGREGVGDSYDPSLSADGRTVIFYSSATNLVANDTNGTLDVFLHDLRTRETERVSVGAGGKQANRYSYPGGISADGRYVGFWSAASNLVPGDTNREPDVFVRDRELGRTERVSVGPRGRQGDKTSYVGALSADGRLVAFHSDATNLVPDDTNKNTDVFVHDRKTKKTRRISVGSGGAQGDNYSVVYSHSVFSADGRYVVFESAAENLVPSDTNAALDVFVHDRKTATTSRVNIPRDGGQASSNSQQPAISADGRLVSFFSGAPDLLPGDTNQAIDVFLARRP